MTEPDPITEVPLDTDQQMRDAVRALSGRVRSLTATLSALGEVRARQVKIDQRSTDALEEARKALETARHVASTAVTKMDLARKDEVEQLLASRRRSLTRIVISFVMLGLIVGGFLLHRADQAAATAHQAVIAEREHTAELQQNLKRSCEHRNDNNEFLRTYYTRLRASYAVDTSLTPAVRTVRVNNLQQLLDSITDTDCNSLLK